MKETLYILAFCSLVSLGLSSSAVDAAESWQAPFDTIGKPSLLSDSVLTFGDVLELVARKNPALRAFAFQRRASLGRLRQAGLRANPELGAEVEDVGWDAPGLRESEITISLSQELELFGQRRARRQVARAEIETIRLETRLSAFDLYLDTKGRFYALVHARERLELSRTSAELAHDIIENIDFRIGKGAALQFELVLAQLEVQRGHLTLELAQQEMSAAKSSLAALWGGNAKSVSLSVTAESEPDLTDLLRRVAVLSNSTDSTRELLQLGTQSSLLRAEQLLAAAESRPTITVSGGYKRAEADNSNSLLFGVSLPLPLFNRNQGTQESLEAQSRSLDYEIDRARFRIGSLIEVGISKLRQLVHRHESIDSLLLPTAEKAYHTLQAAYQAGRVPYTQLLEAERSLNELRFEHNDMLLEIHQQIIALEALTGVTLRIDKEKTE